LRIVCFQSTPHAECFVIYDFPNSSCFSSLELFRFSPTKNFPVIVYSSLLRGRGVRHSTRGGSSEHSHQRTARLFCLSNFRSLSVCGILWGMTSDSIVLRNKPNYSSRVSLNSLELGAGVSTYLESKRTKSQTTGNAEIMAETKNKFSVVTALSTPAYVVSTISPTVSGGSTSVDLPLRRNLMIRRIPMTRRNLMKPRIFCCNFPGIIWYKIFASTLIPTQ